MDSFIMYLALLFLPIFLIYFLHELQKTKSPAAADTNYKLPPGKTGWPIIGETWDFAMSMKRGAPEKFVNDRTTKYSTDLFKTRLMGENMAVFCGAAGNKFLFSNENKHVVVTLPNPVEKILAPAELYGTMTEVTKSNRMFLSEYFRTEALLRYIPIMDSAAKQHLETHWSPYKQVTVFPLVKRYAFGLAVHLVMNIQDPDIVNRLFQPFTGIAAGLVSLPVNFPGTSFRRAVEAGKHLREELLHILRQRKREIQQESKLESYTPTASSDVLTGMILEADDDERRRYSDSRTSEAHIAGTLLGLLFASYETISTVVTCIMYHLPEHPHVYKKVMEEQMAIARYKGSGELLNWDDIQKMKYTWCVACEAMRIEPPTPGTFREAITDFTFANFRIPKGWKAFWTPNTTHKNPKYFPNPEKFDPSRFEGIGPAPYTFVPFGGGPRMCLGKEYARLEILVFMHNVVTRFTFKKLNPDEKIIYNPTPIPANGLELQLASVNV